MPANAVPAKDDRLTLIAISALTCILQDSCMASRKCSNRQLQTVLLPEAGTDVPTHKKAEIEVQAVKCVDNCAALPTK